MKEIKIDFDPDRPEHANEKSVEYIFFKYHNELGFPRIMKVQMQFPDLIVIDKRGNELNIELEYESGGFKQHEIQVDLSKNYKVVCWRPTANYSCPVPILTLFDKVKIEPSTQIYPHKVTSHEYIILAYNPKRSQKAFHEWKNVHLFRATQNLGKKSLLRGTLVMIYQKGWIIGEFRIVRHVRIARPRTDHLLNLYHKLVDYPVTLFEFPSLRERKERRNKYWIKHHLFYDNFREYFPPIRFDKKIIGKQMQQGGYIKIDYDRYQKIRGLKVFKK